MVSGGLQTRDTEIVLRGNIEWFTSRLKLDFVRQR